MAVDPPNTNATRSQLADWIEVESLIRPGGVSSGLARQYRSRLEEPAHGPQDEEETGDSWDLEILDRDSEDWDESLAAELDYRREVLGSRYPFRLHISGPQWRLEHSTCRKDPQIGAARSLYRFCLLISAIRDSTVIGRTTELEKRIPKSFERVAAHAARGVLGGDVFPFGWPRDASPPNFQDALEELCRRTNLGAVRPDIPSWSSGREKDAGIDLVAWRGFADERPGKVLMLAQVASGGNWQDKSLKDSDFFSWFLEPPGKHYLPAHFIPFPQHHTCIPRTGRPFEQAALAQAWKRERQLGLVLDRLRIVETAAMSLAETSALKDGSLLARVDRWVTDVIAVAAERS